MSHAIAAIADTGRVRAENQDRVLARRLGGSLALLVVADGVGGAPGGALAAEETVRVVAELFEEFRGAAAPGALLLTAVNLANERIRLLQGKERGFENMATTLVAACIEGHSATLTSLGDSCAYHFHNNLILQVTEDDSWVAGEIREGRLAADAAESHPWRNVITAGIGIADSAGAATVTLMIEPGDALLLCTDGLFRMLSNDEIGAIMGAAATAEDAARALVDSANARGGFDNIGVALWMSKGAGGGQAS